MTELIIKRSRIIADKKTVDDVQNDTNAIKDPDKWVTGGEPMTGAQESYVHTLAEQAGEDVDDNMSKAEASKKIEELQEKTGRGRS